MYPKYVKERIQMEKNRKKLRKNKKRKHTNGNSHFYA